MFTPVTVKPTIKIAIIRSSSIGDVVLGTACLNFLRRSNIPYQLTWIGRGPALQLIAAAYPEIDTVELDQGKSMSFDSLSSRLADVHLVIDLQTSLRSRALGRVLAKNYNTSVFSCSKNSIKRGRMVLNSRIRGRSKSLPESYRSVEWHQFQNMVHTLYRGLRYQLPVESLDGLRPDLAHPELPTEHATELKSWQKELRFGSWVAIAPGAAHETKRAPTSLFVDILESFREKLVAEGRPENSVNILYVGNEVDRERSLEIIDALGWKGSSLNLAGKLSLWESALALKEVSVALTNDSSLSHIAEAVGTPCLVMFGPTVEGFGFSPWREDSQAISSSLGCRPCSKHGKVGCRYEDHLCFRLLSSSDIAQLLTSRVAVEEKVES